MSWREDIATQLRSKPADRTLWHLDERAIAGLREEFTTLPFPEPTAHLYQTVEEVTAAQREYASELAAYQQHAEEAEQRAVTTWSTAIEPSRRRGVSSASGGIARRLAALQAV